MLGRYSRCDFVDIVSKTKTRLFDTVISACMPNGKRNLNYPPLPAPTQSVRNCHPYTRKTASSAVPSINIIKHRTHTAHPSCSPNTSRRFELGASNVCLVGGNSTCSVRALQGCDGLWSYDYDFARHDHTLPRHHEYTLPLLPSSSSFLLSLASTKKTQPSVFTLHAHLLFRLAVWLTIHRAVRLTALAHPRGNRFSACWRCKRIASGPCASSPSWWRARGLRSAAWELRSKIDSARYRTSPPSPPGLCRWGSLRRKAM